MAQNDILYLVFIVLLSVSENVFKWYFTPPRVCFAHYARLLLGLSQANCLLSSPRLLLLSLSHQLLLSLSSLLSLLSFHSLSFLVFISSSCLFNSSISFSLFSSFSFPITLTIRITSYAITIAHGTMIINIIPTADLNA